MSSSPHSGQNPPEPVLAVSPGVAISSQEAKEMRVSKALLEDCVEAIEALVNTREGESQSRVGKVVHATFATGSSKIPTVTGRNVIEGMLIAENRIRVEDGEGIDVSPEAILRLDETLLKMTERIVEIARRIVLGRNPVRYSSPEGEQCSPELVDDTLTRALENNSKLQDAVANGVERVALNDSGSIEQVAVAVRHIIEQALVDKYLSTSKVKPKDAEEARHDLALMRYGRTYAVSKFKDLVHANGGTSEI